MTDSPADSMIAPAIGVDRDLAADLELPELARLSLRRHWGQLAADLATPLDAIDQVEPMRLLARRGPRPLAPVPRGIGPGETGRDRAQRRPRGPFRSVLGCRVRLDLRDGSTVVGRLLAATGRHFLVRTARAGTVAVTLDRLARADLLGSTPASKGAR